MNQIQWEKLANKCYKDIYILGLCISEGRIHKDITKTIMMSKEMPPESVRIFNNL